MTKNIVVFDVETTGLDKSIDRIIQFSAVKADPVTYDIIDTYTTYIKPDTEYKMSLGAYMKHKIKPEFLEDKPTFIDVAADIYQFIDGCVLLGYNIISCDIPFLTNEFRRIGVPFDPTTLDIYDSYAIEQERNNNKLDTVYKRYLGHTMEEDGLTSHDALADAHATLKVFIAQQDAQPTECTHVLCDDNSVTYNDIEGKDGNMRSMLCFNLGKYHGVPVAWINKTDPGYVSWFLNPKSGFAENSKALVRSVKK